MIFPGLMVIARLSGDTLEESEWRCPVVTGQSSDYLLKTVVADMEYYERFLLGRLTRIPGVTGVHSSFELRRVLQRTQLPLEHIDDRTVLVGPDRRP